MILKISILIVIRVLKFIKRKMEGKNVWTSKI